MNDVITCPSCGCEIAVSETLTAQTREMLRREFDALARRKEGEVAKRLEEIRQREEELDSSRLSLEREISNRVAQERDRLLQEAASRAHDSVAVEVQDLRAQLDEAKGKIAEAQTSELKLRKDRRELEDQKNELELTVARTLDAERSIIREQARLEADEENRLKEAEKDNLVSELRRQIDELKRKAERGCPQVQGEVLELELEDLLRDHFPLDTFEPVPKGVHGGDVLQHVHDGNGSSCGTILWESKRTKAWNDNWLPKLRDDQRTARAHVPVLMTIEMPKGLTTFGCIDGVWVTSRGCVLGLAAALRAGMVELHRSKKALEGRQNKVELLYNYLAGSEFRQRVEGIVEAFVTLRDDLEREKRSMQRLWARREKQLERAVVNTAGLYGDLGGIIGPSLPQIANLELAAIAADEEPLAIQAPGAGAEESPY